jgi:antagonist of KipI
MTPVRVLDPGFFTTVQDLGRPGWAHLGVPAAGAADALSLRLGNRLCGNPDGAAALEFTLLGGTFLFDGPARIALAGTEFDAAMDGRPVPAWTTLDVAPGQVLQLASARGGLRGYLCVRGGFAVPPLLGSASTYCLSAFGGLAGRALRKGDRLKTGQADGSADPPPQRVPPETVRRLFPAGAIRTTAGPQAHWFGRAALERFFSGEWRVRESSDRMGLRLSGPVLERRRPGDLLTEGVSAGAVQVPGDGQPIVLHVEHPTTGGYPKIAHVVAADLHRLGQLRPREEVRFEQVALARAVALLREQDALLETALETRP